LQDLRDTADQGERFRLCAEERWRGSGWGSIALMYARLLPRLSRSRIFRGAFQHREDSHRAPAAEAPGV